MLRFFYNRVRVYGTIGHPMNQLLYTELGLHPGSCVPMRERNKEYPLGSLPLFETDHLLVFRQVCGAAAQRVMGDDTRRQEQEGVVHSELDRHELDAAGSERHFGLLACRLRQGSAGA